MSYIKLKNNDVWKYVCRADVFRTDSEDSEDNAYSEMLDNYEQIQMALTRIVSCPRQDEMFAVIKHTLRLVAKDVIWNMIHMTEQSDDEHIVLYMGEAQSIEDIVEKQRQRTTELWNLIRELALIRDNMSSFMGMRPEGTTLKVDMNVSAERSVKTDRVLPNSAVKVNIYMWLLKHFPNFYKFLHKNGFILEERKTNTGTKNIKGHVFPEDNCTTRFDEIDHISNYLCRYGNDDSDYHILNDIVETMEMYATNDVIMHFMKNGDFEILPDDFEDLRTDE